MKQIEFHQLWDKIKPITSDPVIQTRLWHVLLKIIEAERDDLTQNPQKRDTI